MMRFASRYPCSLLNVFSLQKRRGSFLFHNHINSHYDWNNHESLYFAAVSRILATGEEIVFSQYDTYGIICPTLKTQLCILRYVFLGQNGRHVSHSDATFK